MKQRGLEWRLSHDQKSIKIKFQDHRFLSVVKFDTFLPTFTNILDYTNLKQFDQRVVLNFRKEVTCEARRISELKGEIEKKIGGIKEMWVTFEESTKKKTEFFFQIHQKLQVSDFLAYYQVSGRQICLFCEKKETAKLMVKSIKNFRRQQLLFPIHDIFYAKTSNKLREKLSDDEIQKIGLHIAKKILPKMETEALNFYLKIHEISSNISHHKKQPSISLFFDIEGNILHIFQFYKVFEQRMKNFYFNVAEVDKIYCENVCQVLPETVQLIGPKILLVFDELVNIQELVKSLRTKSWDVEEFTEEEIKILEKENKKNSLKIYMKERDIYWEKIIFNKKKLILKCEYQMQRAFKREAKEFLFQFQKVQSECYEFSDTLSNQIFYKYYQEKISELYYAEFSLKEDKLWVTCFSKDVERLKEQLKQIKEEIQKGFKKFYWPTNIHKEKSFSGIVRKIKKDKTYGRLYSHCFKKEEMLIKTRPFEKIYSQKKPIILMINEHQLQSSQYKNFLDEHSVNLKRFIQSAHTGKPCRVKQYFPSKSKYLQHITFFYVKSERNNRFKQQVQQLVENQKDQEVLHILLPSNSGRLVEEVFEKFLDTLNDMKMQKQTKSKELNFYYEDDDTLQAIEDQLKEYIYEGEKIKRKTKKLIEGEQLLYINNIEDEKILQVRDQNKKITKLSPILTYIFNYQFGKNSVEKSILCVPKQVENIREYVASYNTNLVYKIESNLQTSLYNPNAKMKLFIESVKNYFVNLEYFVFYGTEEEDDFLNCFDLFLAHKNKKNRLKSIRYRHENKKITHQDKVIDYRVKVKNQEQSSSIFEFQIHEKEAEKTLEIMKEKK